MSGGDPSVAQHRVTVAGIDFYWVHEPTMGRPDPEFITALPVNEATAVEAPEALNLNQLPGIASADPASWRGSHGEVEKWVSSSLEQAFACGEPVLIDYLERCHEAAEVVGPVSLQDDIERASHDVHGRSLARESHLKMDTLDDEDPDMEVRVGLDSTTRCRIDELRNGGWKAGLDTLGVRELRMPQAELEGSTLRVRPTEEAVRLDPGEGPDLELVLNRDWVYVAWGPYTSEPMRFDDRAIALDVAYDAAARRDAAEQMHAALSPAHAVLDRLSEEAEAATRMLSDLQAIADRDSAPVVDFDHEQSGPL